MYRNVDGYREEDGRYAAFMSEISGFIPQQRQFTDPVRTFAYGTDASFYRLNPKLVVKVGPFSMLVAPLALFTFHVHLLDDSWQSRHLLEPANVLMISKLMSLVLVAPHALYLLQF